MINQQQYLDFVIRPQELQSSNSGFLYDLIQKFPYCQTSQLLYLLSLLNENNIEFPGMLKVVAAYAGDRRVLKDMVERFKNPPIERQKENIVDHGDNESLDSIAVSEISVNLIDAEPPQTDNEILTIAKKVEAEVENKPIEPILESPDKDEEFSVEIEKPASQPEKSFQKKSNVEIIDQFIEKAPRITRSRSDFFNPVDYARNSTIDKEEIVSETLAAIYYEQGNIAKAIKIYEKLSLRYPEKSSYFAALIKKIKSDNQLNT